MKELVKKKQHAATELRRTSRQKADAEADKGSAAQVLDEICTRGYCDQDAR